MIGWLWSVRRWQFSGGWRAIKVAWCVFKVAPNVNEVFLICFRLILTHTCTHKVLSFFFFPSLFCQNCSHISHIWRTENRVTVVTGGDDNAIVVSFLEVFGDHVTGFLVQEKRKITQVDAHSSSINGQYCLMIEVSSTKLVKSGMNSYEWVFLTIEEWLLLSNRYTFH
jgi:hypothetical protein